MYNDTRAVRISRKILWDLQEPPKFKLKEELHSTDLLPALNTKLFDDTRTRCYRRPVNGLWLRKFRH